METGVYHTPGSISGGTKFGKGNYTSSPSKHSREEQQDNQGHRETPRDRVGKILLPTPRGRAGDWEIIMDEDDNVVRFSPKMGVLSTPGVRLIIWRVFSSIISLSLIFITLIDLTVEVIFAFTDVNRNNHTQLSETTRLYMPKLVQWAAASYMVRYNYRP